MQEIKTAYRKLSIKFHPDKNAGDRFFEERFMEIQEAYEVLSDSTKRQTYDFHRRKKYPKSQEIRRNEQATRQREEAWRRSYATTTETPNRAGFGATIWYECANCKNLFKAQTGNLFLTCLKCRKTEGMHQKEASETGTTVWYECANCNSLFKAPAGNSFFTCRNCRLTEAMHQKKKGHEK